MLLIQQQRIIGFILLASIITALAAFLIINSEPVDTDDSPDDIHIFVDDVEIQLTPELKTEKDKAKVKPIIIKIPKVTKEKPSKSKVESEIPKQPSNRAPKKVTTKKDTRADKQKSDTSQLWLLQIASFSIKAGAKAVQKQVNRLGYKATIHESSQTSPKLYRVRIGPESNKRALDDIAVILNQKLGLKSQVIRK